MFLFDIVLYFFFAYILALPVKMSMKAYPNGTKKIDRYLWRMIWMFAIIYAVRWNVGGDFRSYTVQFMHGMGEESIRGEYLFYWFTNAVHDLGFHFSFGWLLLGLLQMSLIVLGLKNYRHILMFIPLALFGSRYFLDLAGAVRQMTVACGFVYASRFIYEKDWKRYLVFIAIASLIHHSAYMLLPFFFLPKDFNISKHKLFLLGVFILCFIAGQIPAFRGVISYAENFTSMFGYEDKVSYVNGMLSGNAVQETLTFGPIMLSFFLTALLIIIYGDKLRNKYKDRVPYFDLWFVLSYFFSCAYFLVCNISHYFIRPVQYFEFFQMVMVALLFYDLYTTKRLRYYLSVLIVCTCMMWGIVKGSSNRNVDSSTYKVFFLHMDDVNRLKNIR